MIKSNKNKQNVLITPKKNKCDNEIFENSLRPGSLNEFIGQDDLKKNLTIFMTAAKKRDEALEHVLFYGPPGLGKTTLSTIIAREMKVNMKITSGPALEKPGDIVAILTNLKDKDLLFIDEIHRIKPNIEEILYTSMEDYAVDLVLGKGPQAKVMRLRLPKFTLVGATTKASKLSSPLRDRFGSVFKLQYYKDVDIKSIILRSAKLINIQIDEDASEFLASTSRKTPRVANRLLRRVRDYAEVDGLKSISLDLLKKALKLLGIDHMGLDETDRDILKVIIEKFNGGPVGISTIAASVCDDEENIEGLYEPYLIKLGLLARTQRGRVVTDLAYSHLALKKK